MAKKIKKLLKIINKSVEKSLMVLMLFFILNLCLPHVGVAQSIEIEQELNPQLPLEAGKVEILIAYPQEPTLPQIKIKEPRYTIKMWVTAYNSLPNQTDASPCITASGLDVCQRNMEDIIATNYKYLPFGTKIRLPELFGDKIFTIEDRMNQRYYRTADIWMKDFQTAKKFGRKWTTIEIL
ncbi:3D domain-containing protein [Patescibacteria group bacterium]|nr:3D domain-containing protein [Patescibacteria group bacterium]